MATPRNRRRVQHHPAIVSIEFHPPDDWVVGLEGCGQMRVCTCVIMDYALVQEEARRLLGCELEPLTHDQWLGLASDIIFARYEEGQVNDPA